MLRDKMGNWCWLNDDSSHFKYNRIYDDDDNNNSNNNNNNNNN